MVLRKHYFYCKHKLSGGDSVCSLPYSSSDEDSDEEALDDSVCPPGCDQSLFNRIVDLREKRLDLEESLTEEKKVLDMQRKELDSMNKKAKSMENQVKTALQELQAFQLKKQQRLNELDQVRDREGMW